MNQDIAEIIVVLVGVLVGTVTIALLQKMRIHKFAPGGNFEIFTAAFHDAVFALAITMYFVLVSSAFLYGNDIWTEQTLWTLTIVRAVCQIVMILSSLNRKWYWFAGFVAAGTVLTLLNLLSQM
ncbi:hypothetical protein KAZ57_02190 [Patescibacteria group bacterium]|nr:hypothetical protein [Patescibacteria group bacterium]